MIRTFAKFIVVVFLSLGAAQAKDSAVIKANDKFEMKVEGADGMSMPWSSSCGLAEFPFERQRVRYSSSSKPMKRPVES